MVLQVGAYLRCRHENASDVVAAPLLEENPSLSDTLLEDLFESPEAILARVYRQM